MRNIDAIIAMAVIFFAVYRTIKAFLDFYLKKRIISNGHFGKAEILGDNSILHENNEAQKYPSLKLGLLFLFTGIGIILSCYFFFYCDVTSHIRFDFPFLKLIMSAGIILVSISLGFLIYFFIVMKSKK